MAVPAVPAWQPRPKATRSSSQRHEHGAGLHQSANPVALVYGKRSNVRRHLGGHREVVRHRRCVRKRSSVSRRDYRGYRVLREVPAAAGHSQRVLGIGRRLGRRACEHRATLDNDDGVEYSARHRRLARRRENARCPVSIRQRDAAARDGSGKQHALNRLRARTDIRAAGQSRHHQRHGCGVRPRRRDGNRSRLRAGGRA